jgi:hypothetical protein
MGCSCSSHSNDKSMQASQDQAKVDALLESVGLREIIEQGRQVFDEAGRTLSHVNRSERAQALGFGPDLTSAHSAAATRSNSRTTGQASIVIARIDHRIHQKDWQGNVDRVRVAYKDHGGAEKLKDLRADVQYHLLHDDPGLSAHIAALSMSTLDSAIAAASDGDLNKVVGHLREIMSQAQVGFESQDMGRQRVQPSSPLPAADVNGWCVALAACLAWAISSLIASLIVCAAVPFCWCCFSPALLFAWAGHMAICTAVFAPNCH